MHTTGSSAETQGVEQASWAQAMDANLAALHYANFAIGHPRRLSKQENVLEMKTENEVNVIRKLPRADQELVWAARLDVNDEGLQRATTNMLVANETGSVTRLRHALRRYLVLQERVRGQ